MLKSLHAMLSDSYIIHSVYLFEWSHKIDEESKNISICAVCSKTWANESEWLIPGDKVTWNFVIKAKSKKLTLYISTTFISIKVFIYSCNRKHVGPPSDALSCKQHCKRTNPKCNSSTENCFHRQQTLMLFKIVVKVQQCKAPDLT